MKDFNEIGVANSAAKEPRYADLTKDSGFKAVFADKEDHSALITLLNTFLPEDRKIVLISHLGDREQDPETKESGITHLDLHCVDSLGRNFIVEMQRGAYRGLLNRFITYISKTFASNFKSNDKDPVTGKNKTLIERYTQMPPVYLVAFLLKEMREEELNRTESLVSHIVPHDIHTAIKVPPVTNLILVRLYLAKTSVSKSDSDWEKCCFTLKNSALFSECPPEIEESPYAAFVEKAEIANFDAKKAKLYWTVKMKEEQDQLIYEQGIQDSREEGRAEGLAAGIAKGRTEGRAEGLAAGVAKGRTEGRAEGFAKGIEEGRITASLETAKRMIAKGMSKEIISELTGLGMEQLAQLL